jgi:hypothetical protein
MIDPVCLFHGKRRSEHEGGRCLFCGICFDTLTPEECWEDAEGQKWDVCALRKGRGVGAQDTRSPFRGA